MFRFVRIMSYYSYMSKRTIVGIDIGTYQVRVVIAVPATGKNRSFPQIIGTGFAESKGLRHGYIINAGDVSKSLAQALSQAEAAAGVRVRSAYLSVGGVGLEEFRTRAEIVISRADSEVTELDVAKAQDACENAVGKKLLNRKILHAIPIGYTIDGQDILGRPLGMKGTKLGVETLFVATLEQHLEDLIAIVEDLGVSVTDVMASPLAGSFVTLTRAQKMTGCILANIGAETISMVVYEDNTPISVKVFPVGSTDITNDIALGLKISLDDAEQLKRGTLLGTNFSQRKLDDIIQARLTDMFDLVEAHLKKIGKSGLLPAGVIISGGGSGVATVEDLARNILRLPTKRANLAHLEGARIRDASWAVAYGLCIWGMTNEEESRAGAVIKQVWGALKHRLTQLLP